MERGNLDPRFRSNARNRRPGRRSYPASTHTTGGGPYPPSNRAYDSDEIEDLQWTSAKVGFRRPQQPVTQANLLNAVQEHRSLIEEMYGNSVKAVNIAGVFAGLVILLVLLLIALNIFWWIYHTNVKDLANENKQDIKDLSDDVSAVVTNLTGTNHSILSGLGNDDHLQYALETGRPTTEFLAHAADGTIHFTEGTIDLTSLGGGVAITPGDRDVKSLVEGVGVTIASTATEITISANITSINDVVDLESIGTGEPVTPGGVEVRSIQGGDGISVEIINNDTIEINSTASLTSVGNGTALPAAGDLDVKSLTSDDGSIEYTSTSQEVDLSVNLTYIEDALNLTGLTNLGGGTVLSPGDFDVKSLTSSSLVITSSGTEVNLEINDTAVVGLVELNDISTGVAIKGFGSLDVRGIRAGVGGEITVFTSGSDVVIGLDTNAVDLNNVGSGESLAAGGLDIRSLVQGVGILISSGPTEVTIDVDISVVYPSATTLSVVLNQNLLIVSNAISGEISTAGGSITSQSLTSDCPGASDVAVGCNCDRNLNSGDPALIMFKAATIFSNITALDEKCICEWEVAHANGANYTFSAQAVCLRFGT